ncbi:MAG: hypothetical protein OXF79_14930 [Chloroflexi bacterium]|nr:hypothetical protein [Chloroflexota bacterium]
MPTGPRGEKRPNSPVSSMVKAMKVVTGIEPEEYVDGKPRIPVGLSSEDELEEDHMQIAAMRVADPGERTKPKKRKKRKK